MERSSLNRWRTIKRSDSQHEEQKPAQETVETHTVNYKVISKIRFPFVPASGLN
jgi:hypothetical protein